jgi:ferritin-like metal-binding protein YciE
MLLSTEQQITKALPTMIEKAKDAQLKTGVPVSSSRD